MMEALGNRHEEPVALKSGVYRGSTVHRETAEETIWQDVHLCFQESETNAMRQDIVGYGTSGWRDESVPFIVVGYFSPKTRCGRLLKQHVHLQNNAVVYEFRVDPELITLQGRYSIGT